MPLDHKDLGESDHSVTALLTALSQGNFEVQDELISLIYNELRRLAKSYMSKERSNHTLQPTALVHEAYARLQSGPPAKWENRAHFFAVSAQLMRHILVDHARARRAGKRGGLQQQVTLDDGLLSSQDRTVDLLALNEALGRLTVLDPRHAKIVELRSFGGLGFEEIASVLNLSESTIKREWGMARAWLRRELSHTR